MLVADGAQVRDTFIAAVENFGRGKDSICDFCDEFVLAGGWRTKRRSPGSPVDGSFQGAGPFEMLSAVFHDLWLCPQFP